MSYASAFGSARACHELRFFCFMCRSSAPCTLSQGGRMEFTVMGTILGIFLACLCGVAWTIWRS
ncbi:hypothetical protein [Azorhizobium caulinodans]|uniref:hypothetical protein n=1 Tax=Azorhizobium caulinodans TaxID=7 RepID=UPI0011D07DBF|nr:hypothetical protein [Azorhizobium caulinodans]